MTSPYSTDAASLATRETSTPLLAARDGYPVEGQVPCKSITVTATGAVPSNCPSTVVISSGTAVTLTATSLANLVGRRVTFASDGTNAIAHVIQLPANSLSTGRSKATFALDAECSITFAFVSLTHAVIVGSNGTVTIA